MKLNIHLHYEGNHNFPGEEEKWGGETKHNTSRRKFPLKKTWQLKI